jgi:hypothetical protein
MDGAKLQDRLQRAAGRSAEIIGETCDLYRPQDASCPISPSNRILRLKCAFMPLGGSLRRPVLQSQALWQGLFDSAYTQPGDLLRRSRDGAIFFVAAQQPLLPVLCVRALRLVTIKRSATANQAGLNLYGGVISATEVTIAEAWPASMAPLASQGTADANITAGITAGAWQVLLPSSLKLELRTTDHLFDDQGRVGVIASAETSDLWTTLTVRQAST